MNETDQQVEQQFQAWWKEHGTDAGVVTEDVRQLVRQAWYKANWHGWNTCNVGTIRRWNDLPQTRLDIYPDDGMTSLDLYP